MKKILSILICVVLGISSAWAANGATKLHAYAILGSTYEEGGAKVTTRASNADGRIGHNPISGTQHRNTYSSVQGSGYCGSWITNGYDLYATYESIQTGYFFSGWYSKTNDTYNKISTDIEYHKGYGGCEGDGTLTIYAIFQPITVTGYTVNNISISDINTAGQGTVVFNVTNSSDVDVNDFDYNITGDGFSIVNKSYASGKLTVTVQYTSQTTDNVNGDLKPDLSATVTLTSKGDNSSSQTATIKANVSLVPTFTIPTDLDLTPDAPALTAAPAQQSFTITTNNQVAANASWDASLPQEAKDLGFSVENTGTAVTVNFTPKNNDYEEDLTATLSITGTYTDSNEKIITHTQNVPLSADKGSAVKIDGKTNASCDFGTKEYTGQAYTKDLSFTSNIIATDLSYLWFPADFEHEVKGNIITITLPGKLIPGDYSGELSVKYNAVDVAYLTASAKVRLAQPQIESKVYMSQVLLTWKNVYGAKQYILKSGETVIDISDVMTLEAIATASTSDSHTLSYSKMITAIGDAPLSTGTEYPFTLTVVYGDDVNNINDVTKISSATITATPTVTTTITAGDVDFLGIYTGTEKAGAYPYHKDGKRLVDLSAAFKDDKAIFDQLFIFGLTTGDANNNITKPTATTNSNAVTPCYIYTKSGNNYTLSKTISNVNVETKPTEFNITDMSKSYYFTGYAPYASCGSTWEENAVFLFTSSGNSVNLYFDNLELYARPKAATGNKVPTKTYTANDITEAIGLINDPDIKLNISPLELYVYVQGSGAAFAFASTSTTAFQPTIHLRGKNVLESTAGATVHVTSTLLSLDASAAQVSSPIQVLLKKDGGMNSKTTLTITDIWVDGITHTNGILDLANLDVRPAPTIDLGNANTTLNINGGQYFLSNAANTSISYTVSYAISYRKKSMAGDKAQMFGLGDDQPEGKVRFKDGSINCSVLPKNYFNENLYHNQTSMKCPKDTKIDGGTFNCDVLACTSTTSKGGSPTNTAGQALCMVGIPIKSVDNANGTAILEADWMEYAAANGANTDQLDYYGIKSMTPITITDEDENETQVVNLLLPSDKVCFMEVVRIPWVLCTPSITINQSGMSEALGGNELVQSSITEGAEGLINVVVTSRLLYAEMDDITKAAVDNYQTPGGYKVEIGDNNRQYITNEDSYVVKDKIYWVRPIIANEWQMVVPPFDVANIYVVEAYPEAQLLADFGDGKKIADEDQISAARTAQAKRMMDFFYYWWYDADPAALGNDNDLWPNKGWDMSKFMREWVDYEVETYGDAYKPIIDQLYHFTGNNWDANYYLYETDGVWDYSFDGENDKFTTDWTPVQTQSVQRGKGTPQTIMHKGGVYSICFPYSIFNTEHDPYTEWDYWTGKYIIMEGYPTEEDPILGPVQVLSGTETDWDGVELTSTVLADFTNVGQASLRGNYTFGQLPVQKENAFYLNGNRYTPRAAKHTLEPSQGFLLANDVSTLAGMPRRIKTIDLMSGEVTYEEGEGSENGATGTPTIAGNNKMLVYNINGGVGIVPVVAQQVSIYNAAGQVVTSEYLAGETQLSLPAGIYLVCGEYEQYKVLVK